MYLVCSNLIYVLKYINVKIKYIIDIFISYLEENYKVLI